jgi:hypothetical protein
VILDVQGRDPALIELHQLHVPHPAIVLHPEDDKGDDYFLVPDENKKDSFHLIRIDNERVFYHPDQDQGWITSAKVLQVKSILYCLPQMKERLSSAILNKFLELL